MLLPKEFEDILDGIKRSLSGKTNPRTKKPYSEDEFYAIATEAYKKKYGKNPHGKSEDLSFRTDTFEYKAEDENYFVCGYASTTGIDQVNDLVTSNCLSDMASQLLNKEVAVKLGIEHDWVRTNDPRILPYAKVVDAKVLDGNKLFVKTKLFKEHPNFKTIWSAIKEGYLDAFSIEYLPQVKWSDNQNGKNVRVLDKVELSGITFTGRPINPNARITDVFVKAALVADAEDVMKQILHSEGVPTAAPVQEAKSEEPDPEQLRMGIEVEMEHTSDPAVAEKIARDHLKEVSDYYTKLKKVENKCSKGDNLAEEEAKPEAKAEVKADEKDLLIAQLKAKVEELEKKTEIKALIKDAIKELQPEEKALKDADKDKAEILNKALVEAKSQPENKFEAKSDMNNYTVQGMIEKAFGKPKI